MKGVGRKLIDSTGSNNSSSPFLPSFSFPEGIYSTLSCFPPKSPMASKIPELFSLYIMISSFIWLKYTPNFFKEPISVNFSLKMVQKSANSLPDISNVTRFPQRTYAQYPIYPQAGKLISFFKASTLASIISRHH